MKNHLTAYMHGSKKIGRPGKSIAGDLPKQAGIFLGIVSCLSFREQNKIKGKYEQCNFLHSYSAIQNESISKCKMQIFRKSINHCYKRSFSRFVLSGPVLFFHWYLRSTQNKREGMESSQTIAVISYRSFPDFEYGKANKFNFKSPHACRTIKI